VAEHLVDPPGLPGVRLDAAEPLGVDVVDLLGADAGVGQGGADRPGQARAGAVGVEGGAEADHLGVDLRPALLGVFQFFQHQHPAALAEHGTVAAAVERPARLRRLVVAVRQPLEQAHPHQAERVDLALGAADQEEVGLVAAQDAVRLAQGQEAGHVVLGDGVVRPLGVVQDRDVAGEHVRQVLEHPQRWDGRQAELAPLLQIDAAGLAVGAGQRRLGDVVQLAGDERRAELDAEAARVELGLVHAGVVQGQLGGGHGQLDGAGHDLEALARLLVLLGDEALGVEVGHLGGDLHRELAGVHRLDAADAAAAGQQRAPERRRVGAHRGDHAEAGHDRTTGGGSHGTPGIRSQGSGVRNQGADA
jgi:hypothetical protein